MTLLQILIATIISILIVAVQIPSLKGMDLRFKEWDCDGNRFSLR